MNRIILLLILTVLSGCEYLQGLRNQNNTKDQKVIARVHDKILYEKDLKGITQGRLTSEDSANITSRFVDLWIKKQLMLHVAEENTEFDEEEINRRVEDYKYDLLVYAYEKNYIEGHLDTVVTEEQIQEYYLNNKDNFELRQNIVKGIFVKVPNGSRRMNSLKRWMSRGQLTKNLEDIREYAYGVGGSHHLTDSVWVDFEELIAHTPFMTELTNRMRAVKSNQLLETSDSLYTYYLRVLDFKLLSDTSPLGFVKDQIRDIIINKRKVELRKKHESEIWSKAEKNKEYEIFK